MSTASPSIAHEFYKVREAWERVDRLKSWKLAIWVAQYQDIDIIDKFMETERLAIGVFDDIFFRFDTTYAGDPELFERELWLEYQGWFAPCPDPRYDIYGALKKDGILDAGFKPDIRPLSGFGGLMQELLRLKASLSGYDDHQFLLYFPSGNPEAISLKPWLKEQLKKGIPEQIRLATMDYGPKRKIYIPDPDLRLLVVELVPQLNMSEAINNELNKNGGTSDTVSIENRLRKQIRVVMDTTLEHAPSLTAREVGKLMALAKEAQNNTTYISSLLVASQAHYAIKDSGPSEAYAIEAIRRAQKAMADNDPAGYPVWRSCMMLRGGLFAAKRKWEDAIKIYDEMAEEATRRADAFFIMEGHRISGHLYFIRGRQQQAFEKCLLAMVGGAYMDQQVIRQSTFLHAAFMAVHLGKKIKAPDELIHLYDQLRTWIGEDWEELLTEIEMHNILVKPRGKFSIPIG